jgi:site-specific recombinase XerD
VAKKGSEPEDTLRRYLEMVAATLRPSTVAGYRSQIGIFIQHLKTHHPELSTFSELERSDLQAWLRHLGRSGLRPSSRRDKIVKVRAFLERIESWGWKEASEPPLLFRTDLPPPDRYLPRPLSEESDRALKEYLKKRGGLIPTGLLLLRATGLRCQELLDLKVDALKCLPENQWALHVPLGKLHSERVVPLDKETASVFEEICQLRGHPPASRDPETGKPAQFLIVRPEGDRPSPQALRYHLRKAEERARLKEHPTPHRLRHTYATEMLRAGMRLPVLMKLLGHRTINMTLRYAEVSGVDVQRAYVNTIETIERRYDFPQLPLNSKPSNESSARRAIRAHLGSLYSELEAFRRDYAEGSTTKPLQRLAERTRRLARDFEALA